MYKTKTESNENKNNIRDCLAIGDINKQPPNDMKNIIIWGQSIFK